MQVRPLLSLFLASLALGASLTSCGPAVPRRHLVEMKQLGFSPAQVEAALGDTIAWVNHDLFPHTATADRGSGWEVGPLLPGGEGSHVVTAPGRFTYHCRLHPTMQGTIVVAAQR